MDVGRHPRIRLLAYSEVEKVEGEVGNFRVTVRKKPRYVNESKCTGCGSCAEKCPTVTSDAYNLGLGKSKAIFKYFAQGIPSSYTIDASVCRNFQQGKKCGVCAKVCQAGAIDYKQEEQILEVDAGAIILATGYELFDAGRVPEYGYGRIPNVVTALEFERFLSASGPTHGHVYRRSDLQVEAKLPELEKASQKVLRELEKFEKTFSMTSDEFFEKFEAGELTGAQYDEWAKAIKGYAPLKQQLENARKQVDCMESAHRIAFIQCVGSRDKRFNEYCSGFCCMHSVKEAIIAREHDREAEIYIFGMDIRAVGKGFEEYRNRAGEAGVTFVRSRVAEVTENAAHNPILWFEDTKNRIVRSLEVDLVVLATGCEPSPAAHKFSAMLGIPLTDFGFYKTKTVPALDTSRPGIFTCGCAQGPMDIPESVAQASGCAARAAQALSESESMRLVS
ncbi:MAG: FAD-dependent oxidoreductase [Desulfobacteraceae bacterium]|nr:FAD-dependent oxidoreductase [Desulfobacteraceae bacterium]